MKKKLTRILGVALPLAMVLALAVTLLPASTPAAEAGVGTLKFENIPLPKFGDAGDWLLAPTTELGVIAAAPDGSVMFASANTTSGSANVSSLLRSSDGGYTWTTLIDAFSSTIVDIAVSPEYSSDTTVMVATEERVWTSVDGGTIFTGIQPTGWDTDETITDMDVILDEGGRLATMVGSSETTGEGDVWVQCPATTGSWWEAQEVGRDVLAVAFSPNFASDECIMAVTANLTGAEMRVSFGSTKDGGGWGESIGDAEFLDGSTAITNANRARIAFPDDFDVDSLTSNIALVGLGTAGAMGDTAELGDAFKVVLETGSSSTAIDLNVRGIVGLQLTYTNIWSIDVSGDAEAANIIVGLRDWSTATTPDYWLAYYSTDTGENWYSARTKSPTGGTMAWTTAGLLESGTGAQANVLMAPDFATSGVAYAITKGAETSALSRTADGGKSWNQISLIDYSNTLNYYTLNDFDPNVMFGSTPTAYLTTVATKTANTPFPGYYWLTRGAVWKTTDGGGRWERILSYANPSVTDQVATVKPAGGDTIFACDFMAGKLWRSSDGGATFPRVVTTKLTYMSVCEAKDETTLHTADYLGNIWTTTNLGRPWVEPDESIVDDGVTGIVPNGDIWLVSTMTSGKVFISTDGGVTITDTVGVTNLPAGYITAPAFDADYDTNHLVYAANAGYGGGIWRIELNEENPDSTIWKRIDGDAANLAAGGSSNAVYAAFQLVGPTLYCYDYMSVNTTANTGGLWRSVNPASDIDGLYPPRFEKTQTGLTTGMGMGYAGYAVYPNTVFMKEGSVAGTVNCDKQLYAFGDVLSSPVGLVLPDDGATDVGVRLETIDLTMEVLAGWETMPSALSYQYQLALDEEFLSPIADQSATEQVGQQARFTNLPMGETYYWRARVDSPLLSPWSAGRSFTVGAIEPEVVGVPFGIVSPELGASDVSIQPTFVWVEVEGATSYELVVAEDPTFAIIDWSRTSANTFYKAEEALAYSTTYAWKVRAAPDGPWATGVFTTEAVPVEPVEPGVIAPTEPAEIKIVEVPTAAPIPTYLLWIIIGVGAVLFIALIVLIVRTRRVT